MNKKVTSIFAYCTFIGWLIAFLAGDKENSKFHLNQGLVLAIVEVALYVCTGMLSAVPLVGGILAIACQIVNVARIVLAVLGIIAAAKDGSLTLEKVLEYQKEGVSPIEIAEDDVFPLYNALGGNVFLPHGVGFVIVFVNGNVNTVYGHFQHFGTKLPRPSRGFVFKIITKAKIAQHFKICAVASRFTHTLNIGRTNTFLASRHPLARRCYFPRKIFFHRCHAGVD